MAYAPNEEEKNQQQVNPQIPPTTSSAPGAGPGATGKSASNPQAAPAQPFQNLQAYLGANAPQVNQQAATIAGNLGNQLGQVKSDIDTAKTDFGKQVTSGYTAPNQDVINQAVSNPVDFAKDPNNVKAFQSLYNDAYTGPSNFESSGAYGDLNAKINKAANDASLVNSTGGLQTYLQGQNPASTKGGNVLDTVLLQGTPSAYEQVRNAAKSFESLPDYLNTATTGVNADIAKAVKTAGETSQGLKNQFIGQGGIIPGFESGINTNVQKAFDTNLANTKARNNFLSGNLTPDDLAYLGMTQEQANELMTGSTNLNKAGANFDLSQYFTNPLRNPDINAATVATPQDYAKAQVFSQLTGEDLSSFLNPAMSNLAGTGTPYNAAYDYARALDMLNAEMSRFPGANDISHPSLPGYQPPAKPGDLSGVGYGAL